MYITGGSSPRSPLQGAHFQIFERAHWQDHHFHKPTPSFPREQLTPTVPKRIGTAIITHTNGPRFQSEKTKGHSSNSEPVMGAVCLFAVLDCTRKLLWRLRVVVYLPQMIWYVQNFVNSFFANGVAALYCYTLSHTHTHSHTHTRSLSRALSRALSLSRARACSLSHSV